VKIAVGIATAGRAEVLTETLKDILAMTGRHGDVLVCPASDSDMPSPLPLCTRAVRGVRGASTQRNAIIEEILAEGEAEAIVFFDDDFIPEVGYLEALAKALNDPKVVLATGTVLADGVTGPGIHVEKGRSIIAVANPAEETTVDLYNGYGCNMGFKIAPVRDFGIRFDEKLPLYSWLEDVDFSRQLAAHGQIVKTGLARGVHLGSKGGRTPGLRLGYSQIANPIYLWRKGTINAHKMYMQIFRNLASNFTNVFRPEAWIDRRGRVVGNLHGILDLITGRLNPMNILDQKFNKGLFGK
jgi:GT2 family glycosyltransferase